MNTAQKQILLEFFITHPYLMMKGHNERFSKEDRILLWSELAQKLNEVPYAASNCWEQWESIWDDLYSELKLQDTSDLTEIDKLFLDLVNNANSMTPDDVNSMSLGEIFSLKFNKNIAISNVMEGDNPIMEDVKLKCASKQDNGETYKDGIKANLDLEQAKYGKALSSSEHVSLVQNEAIISTQLTNDSLQINLAVESNMCTKVNPSKTIIVKSINLNQKSELQDGNLQTQVSTDASLPSNSSSPIIEKALLKKLMKSDLIRIRYLKQKLKMEGEYRKRKLSLMKDLLMVKQRKVRVEEKQTTALIRIARSLDRMIQHRQLHQL